MKAATALVLLTSMMTCSFAIPSSLLDDVKIAKSTQAKQPSTSYASNKVKRAQEVLMYGDQQNRSPSTTLDERSNYPAEVRHHGDSGRGIYGIFSNMPYYNAIPDERIKRAPNKARNLSRIRSKRDSKIMNPKEFLQLLALLDGNFDLGEYNRERLNNYLQSANEGDWEDNNYEDRNQYNIEFDEPNEGEWLETPVVPSVHQLGAPVLPDRRWGYNFKDNNRKRFMVSKRYQSYDDDDDVATTSHFFNNNNNNNNQFWDYSIPVYRRAVL